MAQTLVKPQDIKNDHFVVRNKEAHHVIKVLRKKVDDQIQLFDGKGHQYTGRIQSIHPKEGILEGQIIAMSKRQETKLKINLYQGLPKGSKFDYVIEKCTEVGVHQITPFISEKNIIDLKGKNLTTKLDRWNKLAQAAAKQSGRSVIPHVEEPLSFDQLLDKVYSATTLVFHPDSNFPGLNQVLNQLPDNQSKLNVIIGPEPGFSTKEINQFLAVSTQPVTLGENILRTETAGIVALSVIQGRFGIF